MSELTEDVVRRIFREELELQDKIEDKDLAIMKLKQQIANKIAWNDNWRTAAKLTAALNKSLVKQLAEKDSELDALQKHFDILQESCNKKDAEIERLQIYVKAVKSDVVIDKIYMNGEEMIAVDGMLQPATDKETADEIVNRLDRIDKTNKAIREKYGLPDPPKDSDSSEGKTPHATESQKGVYSDVPPYE